jgi:hypothetical protein
LQSISSDSVSDGSSSSWLNPVVAKAVATRGNRLARYAGLDQQRRERTGGKLWLESGRWNQSTGVKRL